MFKNISSLGTILNKTEQKSITGSGFTVCRPQECPIGMEWDRFECTCVESDYHC